MKRALTWLWDHVDTIGIGCMWLVAAIDLVILRNFFSAQRFRIMTETLRLDSSDVARALNVSHPTVSRIRMGHSQPSGATAKLIQVLWPKWWPFLTEQTNELPEV